MEKIKIDLKANEAEQSIEKVNFAFMFAPNYHQAMKHVAGARKKIAKKGRDKYFKYFNSTIVADFIIKKTFFKKHKKFYWE